jgi:hypothetical protein
MWLLIDDSRQSMGCDAVARTAKSAKIFLAQNEWECVIFDNDLGEKVEGYDIMKWAFENDHMPNDVQLVTSNPVALERMQNLLKDNGYTGHSRVFKK